MMNKFKLLLAIILLPVILSGQETTRDKSMSSLAENSISVTIGGAFIVNGSFPASPFERVDQFVTRIYHIYKAQMLGGVQERVDLEEIQAKLENFAQRDIVLKRLNDKDIVIDLEKFRITGDFKYNPYLKNDDVIIYPPLDLTRNFISIDGAVNRPIKFQFVKGDKLSDAILFAGGIHKAYEKVEEVEINRLSYDGTKDLSIKVKPTDDVILMVGDRIRVLADETNRKEFKALVVGEVNRPGYIPITKNNTTLKDVIEKAGGFKETAALYKAELLKGTRIQYKNQILSKEFEQNRNDNYRFEAVLYDKYDNSTLNKLLLERTTNLIDKDSLSFKMDYLIKWFFRNNIVDFTKLNEDDSYESKTIIDDGDVIIIPKEDNQVYVFGQVASVGYFPFKKDKNFEYYIHSAGGLSASAKELEEVIIIKSRSKNWIRVGETNPTIEPGDFIYVPRKIPVSFTERMNEIMPIASIVSTIATIAILVIQLNK